MARRRKEVASLDMGEAVEPVAMDAAADEQPAESDLMAFVDETPVPAEAPVPAAKASRWLVLEDTVVSLFGQMTTLPAGSFVSVASYGPEAIKRIMEQGVALEPVG